VRARELESLEKLLIKKRAEIMREIASLSGPAKAETSREASGDLSSYKYHMAELAGDHFEREKSFMLSSKARRYLYHIDEALRRIKDGSYGKCLNCGKAIAIDRLRAVPHARFCISCKQAEENSQKS
jgi:RNA polymerase-binding protein DksA